MIFPSALLFLVKALYAVVEGNSQPQSSTPRSSAVWSWEGSGVTSGCIERYVIWTSRLEDRSFKEDALILNGILRQYSDFMLPFYHLFLCEY